VRARFRCVKESFSSAIQLETTLLPNGTKSTYLVLYLFRTNKNKVQFLSKMTQKYNETTSKLHQKMAFMNTPPAIIDMEARI
jgi:hypothetical protein